MKKLLIICAVLILTFVSSSAFAAPTIDDFFVTFVGNEVSEGGGSGFANGAWFYYPNTGWYNQWFYDDPPDRERQKVTGQPRLLGPKKYSTTAVAA